LLNGSGSASPCGFCARDPLGRGTADWAAQVTRMVAGSGTLNSAQSRFPIKKFFFFFKSVLQITNQFEFKSNLNFNDFYSHNKIQEHFITPRKICNAMNGTNDYLL
jgi:hypothetical protein